MLQNLGKVICIVLFILNASLVHAQTVDRPENASLMRFASGSGNIAFLAAGTLLHLLHSGGKPQVIRTLDAVGTSVVLSELFKLTVQERRPDGSTRDSFPSGHATAAFALAAMQPAREQPYWYAGATLIGVSRVTLDRHYVHDVLAGAALGYFTAQQAQRRPHGLLLTPLLTHGGTGLTLTRGF